MATAPSSGGALYTEYLALVRDTFSVRKYRDFCVVLQLRYNGRLSLRGLVLRMNVLLRGHKELRLGLNKYMPEGYGVDVEDKEEPPSTLQEAEALFQKIKGCDASLLLDDTENIVSEKGAVPNKNSLRGFEVIDEIKAKLEEECPGTVSCADTVALTARGSTVLSGGSTWMLPLGRKDSITASLKIANANIPPPNSTLQNFIKLFQKQGLDEADLVALSGSHTIGMARCVSFKQRLYNQNGNNEADATLEKSFYYTLRSLCPRSGGDNNITPLDFTSPTKFDNYYFNSIMQGRGLLNSDEVLMTENDAKTIDLVKRYAEDEQLFFEHYAKSIVKMGNISPLTGFNGEVRKNCRRINEDI